MKTHLIAFMLCIFSTTLAYAQGGVMKIWPSGDICIGSQSIGGPGINIQPNGHTYLVTSCGGPYAQYNFVYANHADGKANIVWWNEEETFYARADGYIYSKFGFLPNANQEEMEEISGIEDALEMIINIRGVTYRFIDHNALSGRAPTVNSDSVLNYPGGDVSTSDSSSLLNQFIVESEMKNYGIIAQELREVLLEAVKTMDERTIGVNYNAIVTILVEAVKELNLKIEKLTAKPGLKSTSELLTGQPTETGPASLLFQNKPNPFNTKTVIKFNLHPEVSSAALLIFDLQGGLVSSFTGLRQNCCEVVVDAMMLKPGMYFYTLITDDREVDTKRMIITK
jgi:hypothetical protein